MAPIPFFLNQTVVEKATTVAQHSVEYLLASDHIDRNTLCVVILNPSFDFSDKNITPENLPAEAILYEKSFNADNWNRPFRFYAYAKALTAMRHQVATNKIKDPDRVLTLQKGDAYMAGGVYEYGLAVGVSGLKGCLDESIAWSYLNFLIGFANLEKEKYTETHNVIGDGESEKF